MIGEAELRRAAARAGVDLMVLDLDYALGWFLAGLFSQTEAASRLIFKGGTCLRKCYFADYRFSEDLDFTLSSTCSLSEIGDALGAVQRWSASADGPDFAAAPMHMEVVADDYGAEVYLAKLYYRGPLRWGGSPRSIRLDISRGEHLAFPTERKPLLHGYSDGGRLPKVHIRCYSLAEMLTEKLRAICGQRRFIIARDLYDLYHLAQAGVSPERVRAALPAKFAAKGIDLPRSMAADLEKSRAQFAADWNQRLAHLLPSDDPLTFEAAWADLQKLVADLQL
jgi:predicted nucleotidyltransferase component of viral defense system